MNDVPHHDDDDIDDLYRRAAAAEPSRPSDAVRQAVLSHAAQHRRTRRRYLPALLGTLAAAVLAGLIVVPRFLVVREPPPIARSVPATPPKAEELEPDVGQSNGSAARAYNSIAPIAAAPAPAPTPTPAPESALAETRIVGVTVTAASGAELRRAAKTGDMQRLRYLLERGADINAPDVDGRTPLLLAVLNRRSDAVELLLAKGADVNTADHQGMTPLHAAASAQFTDIAAALKRAGAH